MAGLAHDRAIVSIFRPQKLQRTPRGRRRTSRNHSEPSPYRWSTCSVVRTIGSGHSRCCSGTGDNVDFQAIGSHRLWLHRDGVSIGATIPSVAPQSDRRARHTLRRYAAGRQYDYQHGGRQAGAVTSVRRRHVAENTCERPHEHEGADEPQRHARDDEQKALPQHAATTVRLFASSAIRMAISDARRATVYSTMRATPMEARPSANTARLITDTAPIRRGASDSDTKSRRISGRRRRPSRPRRS